MYWKWTKRHKIRLLLPNKSYNLMEIGYLLGLRPWEVIKHFRKYEIFTQKDKKISHFLNIFLICQKYKKEKWKTCLEVFSVSPLIQKNKHFSQMLNNNSGIFRIEAKTDSR